MLHTSHDTYADSQGVQYLPNMATYNFPFFLCTMGYVRADPGFFTTRTGRKEAWLVYTLSGTGKLTWHGQTVFLRPGSVALIHCDDYQDYRTHSRERWIHYYMHFEGSGLKAYAPYLLDKLRALYPADTALFDEGFAMLLEDKTIKNDPLSNSRASLLITSFLNAMMAARYDSNEANVFPQNSALLPAIHYIHQHYASRVQIETLSEVCHLSKYHFIREFKRATGESPYQYILHYRINQAKRLLVDTNLSIESIAEQVGFSSPHNFSSQFHSIVTVTPSTYRNATCTQACQRNGGAAFPMDTSAVP